MLCHLFISDFVNLDTVSVPSVSLAKDLSILLIFSKSQILVLLILYIVLFVSVWLISTLSLIISCCLLHFAVFASFCSRAFKCAVKLIVYALSSFFVQPLRAISFPLSTAFIMSHKFGYGVPSFSLNSKKSLISFNYFCYYWRTALIRDVLLRYMGFSIFLYKKYLLRLVLWLILWLILEMESWSSEKKVYSFVDACIYDSWSLS